MKILLSVMGIGLGHATRSEAVYRELSKKADVRVMTWGPAYDYFRKVGIPAGKITGYDFVGDKFTFSLFFNALEGFKDPSKTRRDYFLFAKQVDEFKPDIVISDSDPYALFFSKRRGIPTYTISNLITTKDNYEVIPKELRTRELIVQSFMVKRLMDYMEKRTRRIFVPSFESKVKYMEKVKYTDLLIRKRPSDFPSEKKLKEKLGIDRDFYFVSVGGSYIEKYIFDILRKTLPHFKDKYFVVSSNYMVNKVIEEGNMKILPFASNALEYLKASKGTISPGGHSTISESICFRKPMLVMPLKNHVEQMINAALVRRDGFGEACFFRNKVNSATVRAAMENFFSKEDKINEKINRFKFKGIGAEQIAKEVLNY